MANDPVDTTKVNVQLQAAIRAILGDRPVAYHAVLAKATKSVTAGVLLSQFLYWSPRTHDPEGWFYKKQDDIFDETGLTRYEQEGARKVLRGCGILEEKNKGLPKKLFYRINIENLVSVLSQVKAPGASEPEPPTDPDSQIPNRVYTASKNGEFPHSRVQRSPSQGWGKPAVSSGENPQAITETTAEITTETNSDIYISNGKATLRDSLSQSEPDPQPQRKGRGVTRLRDALADAPSRLARARANPEPLPSGVPPNLAHYVTAWSRELHDSEHVKSNITQAFRLMQQTGMSETAFMQKLTEARAITKERGNIKKPASEYGEFGTKNKVPYWFAVLRDLLGMKEKTDQAEGHKYKT